MPCRAAQAPCDRGLAAGKLASQLRKPIGAHQPLGGRGTGAGRHEAVPPAQSAIARDQPLANRQRLPSILIGDCDLPQAAQQLGRSFDVVGEAAAICRQAGSLGAISLPSQRRGESPPIAASASSPRAAASARS